ncbi:hypothetical protein Tco_0456317 [Tanacetum coccineum]
MNDLESDDESVDIPLVSPFPHSDNDSDDGEVLNELIEYENVGMLRREKAINSFDGMTWHSNKNKFVYKNGLNLGPEYQVDESMKEWLIRGHVSIHEVTLIFDEKKLGSSYGEVSC